MHSCQHEHNEVDVVLANDVTRRNSPLLAEFMIVTIEDGNFKCKAYFQNRDMRACVRACVHVYRTHVRECVRVCTCVRRAYVPAYVRAWSVFY